MPRRKTTDAVPRESTTRVVFVDHSGLPGGGQLGLARYLAGERRTDAEAVVLSPGGAFDAAAADGTYVQVFNSGWRAAVSTPFRLRRAIAHSRPDLVVANSVKAALVLAWIPLPAGTDRVYYMRDDLNPDRNSSAKLFILNKLVLPRFRAFIANSEWTMSTLPERLKKRPSRIAYPVSGLRRVEHSPRPAELRVLSLSRIASWKGTDVLIDAARELEARGYAGDFRLTVAGSAVHADASFERSVRDSAAGLSSQIVFTGHVDDTHSLIADADCLVAVSTTPEPFGQVIAQGMYGELVVVAGDQGGAREQISDQNHGVLIAPGDPQILADALERLIKCPDSDLRKMAHSAMVAAGRFTDEQTIAGMDTALDQLRRELTVDPGTVNS